jgi:flagellar basal-body rod protein FlgG
MAHEQRLAVLTNNLANATTVGFKADKAVFHVSTQPMIIGPVQLPGAPAPVVTSVDPLMTRHTLQQPQSTVATEFTQGALRDTANPLDLALEGKGFFVVETPQGTVYTRQGSFSLNAEGMLVTQNGFPVQGEQGPIRIRGSRVNVDQTGQVLVDGRVVERLKLVDLPQPSALEKMGDTLFRVVDPNAPVQEAPEAVVHQGAVELSNSQLVRLLGEVIQTSRAYEAYQRVIQAFDETASRAANDIASTR